MLTLLLPLALLSPVLADEPVDECPVQPDAYAQRVDAVRELVAFAEPGAEAELTQLELVLVACVDGPITQDTVVRLLLARGAYEHLREGGDPARGDNFLAWAASLGGAEAWDASYGPDVKKRFDAALKRKQGIGVLDLSFAEEVTVVSLDGEIIYEYGLVQVPEGRHVVQWNIGEAWRAEVVEVDAGARRLVGGGPPTPAPVVAPLPGEGEGEEDWREPRGTISVYLGGGADLVSGQAQYDGGGGAVEVTLPQISVEAWYKGLGWWLGVDGAFTGASSNSGLTMPRRAGFAGGLAWGERFSGRFGVGLVAATLPTATGVVAQPYMPTFENETAFGGRSLLELSFGEKVQGTVRGEGSLLSGGYSAGGGASVAAQVGPVKPSLGVEAGLLSRQGVDDPRYTRDESFEDLDRDRYNWIRVEAGLWYAF